MKVTLLIIVGCASTDDVAEKKQDGSKYNFPPRVIDYKGHGTDYTTSRGHINKHTHNHRVHGHHND